VIDYRILVQARMSSSRLPGKALTDLAGRPLIDHVLSRVSEVAGPALVVLVTSNDASDNILEEHVIGQHGIAVFRGALENVFLRYQDCLRHFPCEWFVRIGGDSPFIDPELIALMLASRTEDTHLVSNVVERSFPPGQSVEVVRTSIFQALSTDHLNSDELEHVTSYYYRHPKRFRIRSVTAQETSLSQRRLVVDTLEDLDAADLIIRESPDLTRGYAAKAVVAFPTL